MKRKKLFPDSEQPLINNLAGRLKISTSTACIGVYINNVDYQLTNKFKNKTYYMIFLTIIHLYIVLIFHDGIITDIFANILIFSWVFMNDVSSLRLLFIWFIVAHFFNGVLKLLHLSNLPSCSGLASWINGFFKMQFVENSAFQ